MVILYPILTLIGFTILYTVAFGNPEKAFVIALTITFIASALHNIYLKLHELVAMKKAKACCNPQPLELKIPAKGGVAEACSDKYYGGWHLCSNCGQPIMNGDKYHECTSHIRSIKT